MRSYVLLLCMCALPLQAVLVDSEDFESGVLDSQWTINPFPVTGRVEVSSSQVAAGGNFALLLDQSPAQVDDRLNEAIWSINLSGFTSLELTFFHTDFGEAEQALPQTYSGSANGDGVSISDDGVNWYTVLNATNTPRFVWAPVTIDLSAAAQAAGMTTGSNFRIKFQNFENGPIPFDGRGYDQIAVTGDIPEPTTVSLLALGLAGSVVRRRTKRSVN